MSRQVAQVRIARPTERFDQVVRFYRDGLRFPVVGGFKAHAGYDGVILAVPGHDTHLEITKHDLGSPGAAPDHDNLLVLYIPDRAEIRRIVDRLAALGHPAVEPVNPYWKEKGVTIADPDGWRVVLFEGSGLGKSATASPPAAASRRG